jgi:hypothetical protein
MMAAGSSFMSKAIDNLEEMFQRTVAMIRKEGSPEANAKLDALLAEKDIEDIDPMSDEWEASDYVGHCGDK